MKKHEKNTNQQASEISTNKRKRKISPKRIVITILTALMLIIMFASVGKSILAPWPLSTTFSSPNNVSVYKDNISAVIDQNWKRLSIFNNDGRINYCENIDPHNNNGDLFGCLLAVEDNVYYSIAYSKPGTTYLTSEKVFVCDRFGNNTREIYCHEYDDDEHYLNPCFISIAASNNDVLLMFSNKKNNNLEIISLQNNLGDIVESAPLPTEILPIKSASFSFELKSCALCDKSGKLYVSQNKSQFEYVPIKDLPVLSDCAWGEDGNLYSVNTFVGTLTKINIADKTITNFESVNVYNSVSARYEGNRLICGTKDGADVFNVSQLTNITSDKTYVEPLISLKGNWDYSLLLSLITILRWIAIAYIAIFILLIIIKNAVKLAKSKKIERLNQIALAVVIVIALCGLSIFYSNKIYDISLNDRQTTIDSICLDAAQMFEDMVNSNAESLSTNTQNLAADDFIVKVTNDFSNSKKNLCTSFAQKNVYLKIDEVIWNNEYSIFHSTDADGTSYRRFSTEDLIDSAIYQTINDSSLSAHIEDLSPESANLLRKIYPDAIISCMKLNTFKESVNGIIIVSSNIDDLGKSIWLFNSEISISLLMTFGIIALIFLEGKSFFISIKKRRKWKKKSSENLELIHTRQFNFLMAMTSGFDSTMCVLISKDILTAANLPTDNALVGFPSMVAYFGIFAGILIFGFMSKRVAGKKIYIVSCIAAAILLVGAFVAVKHNIFWAYVLLKFLSSAVIYIPSAMVNIMPYMASKEKMKAKLLQEITMASISGVALGNIMCSYGAEYISNASIYILNIIPLALAVFMGFKILPSKKFYYQKVDKANNKSSRNSNKSSKYNIIKMFTSIYMVSLMLFIVLPNTIAGGYKSILFPLFGADIGMSKTFINNIIVLANIIIFVFTPKASKLFGNLDQRTIVIICELLTGVVFCWFFINQTMIWAILALIISLFLSRVSIPGQHILTARAASKYNVSQTTSGNIESMEANIMTAIRSPMLTSLSSLGMAGACVVVGLISISGTLLFAILTKNSCINPSKDNKPAIEASP